MPPAISGEVEWRSGRRLRLSRVRTSGRARRLPALASVLRGYGGLGAKLAELAGTQVAGDQAALRLGLGQEVDVHLVGAQLCATLADAGQVEGRRVALAAADVPHVAPAILAAMHQQVHGLGQGRAFDQAVDAVDIALAGGTAPEMQPGRQVLRNAESHRLGGRNAAPHGGKTDDTAGHGCETKVPYASTL